MILSLKGSIMIRGEGSIRMGGGGGLGGGGEGVGQVGGRGGKRVLDGRVLFGELLRKCFLKIYLSKHANSSSPHSLTLALMKESDIETGFLSF